ncbi:MAG: hypothetical protein QOE63_1372 [Acidimicrobiaceae bacterium]
MTLSGGTAPGGAMTTPTALLRPALEAAVQVARAGEVTDPTEPVPAALRRFLRFARLPAPALDIARKAIEEDDPFREGVASQLSESDVGEAGWLWLRRPDGWEARLDALRRQRAEADHHEREERAERDAHRRLGHAEDRARRAEALLALRDGELDTIRRELSDVRHQAQQLGGGLEQAQGKLRELHDQRNQAVRRLKEVEAELAQRNADLRQARHDARLREVELADLNRAALARPPLSAAPPPSPTPTPAATPASDVDALDRARLSKVVGAAAAAADALSAALAEASGVLAPAPVTAPAKTPDRRPPPPSAAAQAASASTVRLPPGILDDSVAAADHLCRVAGVLVLVDGYNVSKEAWPSLPIAVQRSRLVDALAELHGRTGADVEVVFDGAEHQASGAGGARAAVRVRFSPVDVEADEVLIELVERLAPTRPVVLVTSDNRVREAGRRLGAHLVRSGQLLALIGR